MKNVRSAALVLVAAAAVMMPLRASAAVINLDFETAATGLNLASGPLATPFGNISFSNGNVLVIGPEGHALYSNTHTWSSWARLDFAFDVTALTFDFNGFGGGVFTAEALDASNNVVTSYYLGSTSCGTSCWDGDDIVLTAPGIRAFRFADAPNGIEQSVVDNVRLNVNSVPDAGSSLLLLGIGLAGLRTWKRRLA